jgi:hypothetical protein
LLISVFFLFSPNPSRHNIFFPSFLVSVHVSAAGLLDSDPFFCVRSALPA